MKVPFTQKTPLCPKCNSNCITQKQEDMAWFEDAVSIFYKGKCLNCGKLINWNTIYRFESKEIELYN